MLLSHLSLLFNRIPSHRRWKDPRMSSTRNVRRNGGSRSRLSSFIAVVTATLLLHKLPTPAAAWGGPSLSILSSSSSRRTQRAQTQTHAFGTTTSQFHSSSLHMSTAEEQAAPAPKQPKVVGGAAAAKKKAALPPSNEYCAERIRNFSIIAHIDHGKVRIIIKSNRCYSNPCYSIQFILCCWVGMVLSLRMK